MVALALDADLAVSASTHNVTLTRPVRPKKSTAAKHQDLLADAGGLAGPRLRHAAHLYLRAV